MTRASALLATIAVLASLAAAPVAPDSVPDRGPVASEPVERGELVRRAAPPAASTPKIVDGELTDWVGTPTRLGGTARLDRGEHVYQDYVNDAWGADDGTDAQRLAVLGPLAELESRTSRVDQLFQAAGEQFGAPAPLGVPDRYGDVDGRDVADLLEVRWGSDGERLHLLTRTTSLVDPSALGVLVLADTGRDDGSARDVGFGSGLSTARFDVAALLTADGARLRTLPGGAEVQDGSDDAGAGTVAVNPDGWANALEAGLPADVLAPDGVLRIALVAGRWDGTTLTPANVAYRYDEPVAGVWNDQRQALALHDGSVDRFVTSIGIADLTGGRTDAIRPGPGYHERVFRSGDNISAEKPAETIWQPYGLFVPSGLDPGTPTPVTYWLHYRGGRAHNGAAWTPRLITQLGEERGDLVVTPHGRGTSNWYVGRAHQDFFEVFEDVEATFEIDPRRRYLSGYSMGGYGTYLFGLLYPDLFAGGFTQSGAVTQGLWTGEGPESCVLSCFMDANEGDADAQLTYRILENARHFPIAIDHGSDDELVPITGVQRMALRLRELGYRYRMTTFAGYEHYTQAIVDEWADGAAYLDRHAAPVDPRHVTYKVVPALVDAVNTVRTGGASFDFDPDGAWWVDGIAVRDGDPSDPSVSGTVDAVARSRPGTRPGLLLPEAGATSPPGHSTPYVRHGQTWEAPADQPISNAFDATLTNVAAASFDTRRMDLDLSVPAAGTVITDGPTTLTLTGVDPPVRVLVDGSPARGAFRGDRIVLALESGSHEIELLPRR